MGDFSKALRRLRTKDSPQRPLFHAESPVSSLGRQLAFIKSQPHRIGEIACLDGTEDITQLGRHLVLRNTYADDHYHGKVRLSRFSPMDLDRFMALMNEEGSGCSRDDMVFLDTETTG